MRNSDFRKMWHHSLRRLFSVLPQAVRFKVYRSFVDCDPQPDARLVLKIADTQAELEACFRLLHDAYVSSGFMRPDPSGLRVTIYHALPTTTTLCAKYDGEVVGTLSLIRESLLGFPLQSVFDLSQVRARKGQLAEVSALAVHPRFRNTGGTILFPLMKFMYDYCTTFFDTRHLLIAVNPNRIEMYESLLFFQRLTESGVNNYDFANGAPAVGASLDLYQAPEVFETAYGRKKPRKNLHQYFVNTVLPNIVLPSRRYYTTNDPVMTPELLDYFFNQRTQGFAHLDERKKTLLHAIYDLETYQDVLPAVPPACHASYPLRQHQRYSVKCPAVLNIQTSPGPGFFELILTDLSDFGFQAVCATPVPIHTWGQASIQLGESEQSCVQVMAVQASSYGDRLAYGFQLAEPDLPWRKFLQAIQQGTTDADLDNATRFLPS